MTALTEIFSRAVEIEGFELPLDVIASKTESESETEDTAESFPDRILEDVELKEHLPGGHDQKKHGRNRGRKQRAKSTHKPVTKEKNAWGRGNEDKLAEALNAKVDDDNDPMDIQLKVGTKTIGIEVKTMLDNSNDKITVHPKSRRRKEQWAKDNNAVITMVVFDDRDKWERGSHKDKWSGNRIYFANRVGALRLTSMQPVGSLAELKKILASQ